MMAAQPLTSKLLAISQRVSEERVYFSNERFPLAEIKIGPFSLVKNKLICEEKAPSSDIKKKKSKVHGGFYNIHQVRND